MLPFTQRVIEIIAGIPHGHVMTYGQIAALAGSPRGARQVVRILHSQSEANRLPWHRVVNAKGEIAIKDDEANFVQKLLLQEEGMILGNQDRVDLEIYQYQPL